MIRRVRTGARDQVWRLYLERAIARRHLPCLGLANDPRGARVCYLRDSEETPVEVPLTTVRGGRFQAGGFREIDPERMPGLYEFMPPDGLFAEGAESAVAMLRFDGAKPRVLWIELVSNDFYDDFSIGIGNFRRTICHDHMSGIFYQLMPTVVRPMIQTGPSDQAKPPLFGRERG